MQSDFDIPTEQRRTMQSLTGVRATFPRESYDNYYKADSIVVFVTIT